MNRKANPPLVGPTEPRLRSREDAARHLGVPLRSFQRHVQPFVPSVMVGRRPMFEARI
jgi:hypothetical protein